jgi:NSS family neurotransmitter:Na+ symporter
MGFVWAAIGSAIGLGSIWRFPYVVGENGGASFVILYLICIAVIGFPVLITEIAIGRKAQLNPASAFGQLGKTKAWKGIGTGTVITGLLVSSFYAVIAAWTLGYLIQALFGQLSTLTTSQKALDHFLAFSQSPFWEIGALIGFLLCSIFLLSTGVRKGIERGNKIMMPLLFIVLVILAIKGMFMPGGGKGISFLFKPDWSHLTPSSILMALGQAFFSLSLGQGTMVTYGSYIGKKENLPTTCLPITLFGIGISLLAGIAIFTIVFSSGLAPTAGESLMFQTLPLIFSQLPGGYLLSLLFFTLLFLAALTSQISAMEPLISYLIDLKKWKRPRAVWGVGLIVFVIGSLCALSFGPLAPITLFGKTFFELLLFLCLNILIPLGGLSAVILLGWRWGLKKGMSHIREGAENFFKNYPFIGTYLRLSIKYIAPVLIVLIMLDALGLF